MGLMENLGRVADYMEEKQRLLSAEKERVRGKNGSWLLAS